MRRGEISVTKAMLLSKFETDGKFFSEPPKIVPFSFDTSVNEGDVAQLARFVSRGDEPLRITWSLKGDIISSEPSLTTTMMGNRASMLMITSVGYRHSGTYTCTASNNAGAVQHSAELKVKGKLRTLGKKVVTFKHRYCR